MLYEIKHIANENFNPLKTKDYNSHYNHPPSRLKEISESDAAKILNVKQPEYLEYRQINHDIDNISFINKPLSHLHGMIFYYWNKTCLMIVTDKYKFRYFLGGCQHKFKNLTQSECYARKISHFGNCYSVTECTLCGQIETIDSSD